MANDSSLSEEDYLAYEFHFELNKERIIISTILIILILVALLGNALVCIAFFRYRRLRVITNYFVLSLAISDLLVAVLSMPMYLSYELTGWMSLPAWIDQMKLIRFLDVIEMVCCISSVANLTAISIDRFFGIVMPLRHKTFMTEKIALICIAVVWAYSGAISLAKFIPRFKHYIVFNFVAGFALPLIFISGAYVFIFLTVRKHAKMKLSNNLSQEWMLARTILIVVSLFVVCWTPFYVMQLLYQYCYAECSFIDTLDFDHVHSAMKLLHFANSCCNPFVYGYFNISFNKAFKSIFTSCFSRKQARDINSNAPDFSLATAYTFARRRSSPSTFNSLQTDLNQAALKPHCNENSDVFSMSDCGEEDFDYVKNLTGNPFGYKRVVQNCPKKLKFVNEALELVKDLTISSLQMKDSLLKQDIMQDEDTTFDFLEHTTLDIDCLLADSKESQL